MTPGMILETWVLFEFLTLSACSALRFDPGVGAGKLPALRAVVDGRASLVTPDLYPAFSSPPYFAAFGRGGAFGSLLPHSATDGLQRLFVLWRWFPLSCVVGGSQIGSQGLTGWL